MASVTSTSPVTVLGDQVNVTAAGNIGSETGVGRWVVLVPEDVETCGRKSDFMFQLKKKGLQTKQLIQL